jgi:hypothetical protein
MFSGEIIIDLGCGRHRPVVLPALEVSRSNDILEGRELATAGFPMSTDTLIVPMSIR